MADDIDIEEHDVLDNPAIKNIFPDISVIKKEISLYDYDVTYIKQEHETTKVEERSSSHSVILLESVETEKGDEEKPLKCYKTKDIVKENQQKHFQGTKLILGSKPATQKNYTESNIIRKQKINKIDEEHVQNRLIQEDNNLSLPFKGTKIILGSKPNKVVENIENLKNNEITIQTPSRPLVRIPTILIQDVGHFIYYSNRYCEDCKTLYPSKSDLYFHKQKSHFETTSNMPRKGLVKHNKCLICNFSFSSKANLRKHLINIHNNVILSTFDHKGSNKRIKNTSIILSKPLVKETPIEEKTYGNTFMKTRNKKIELKVVLDDKISENNVVKCDICSQSFSNRIKLRYHSDNVHKKAVSCRRPCHNKQLLTCNICDTSFVNKPNLRRHYKNIHNKVLSIPVHKTQKTSRAVSSVKGINKTNWTDKNVEIAVNMPRNTVNKCTICVSRFSNKANLIRHYKNIHKKKVSFKRTNNITSNSESLITSTKSKVKIANAKKSCFHCDKNFSDHESLVEHIYKVLDSKDYPKQKRDKMLTKINAKCKPEFTPGLKKEPNESDEISKSLFFPKTFKDKIIFENDDSDSSETSFTEEKEINNSDIEEPLGEKILKRVLTSNAFEKNNMNNSNDWDDEKFLSHNYSSNKTSKNKQKNILEETETSRNVKKRKFFQHIEKTVNEPAFSSKKQKLETKNIVSIGSTKKSTKKRVKSISSKKQGSMSNKNIYKSMLLPSSYDKKNVDKPESNSDNLENVYECIYCSYMVPTSRAYCMHVLGKHKVTKISVIDKVIFNEQCKYCPSKSISVKAHNTHIHHCHSDLLHKSFEDEVENCELDDDTSGLHSDFKKVKKFVLKSIIYKCFKCDIHFLSSCVAKDHEKHMELLINWKCSICKKIFKKHDKYLHMKQHKFSETLNVCQFNESELTKLLYNCTKCGIHFTEERYLEHYSLCEMQTTESVYCKHCDILIDKLGHLNHEADHRFGKNTDDFIVMTGDLITAPLKKGHENESVKIRKRRYEQVNCLTFCKTCKCFLTDIATSRKAHIEARCSGMVRYTCNVCGLVFTNKSINTHRQNHKIVKNLKLQDYKFFDLQGHQIRPPFPEYPRCDNCDVTFVGKNAVKTHICSEMEYITCKICKIKLTENAFKLHMTFHSYRLPHEIKNKPVEYSSKTLKRDVELQKCESSNSNTCADKIKTKISNSLVSKTILKQNDEQSNILPRPYSKPPEDNIETDKSKNIQLESQGNNTTREHVGTTDYDLPKATELQAELLSMKTSNIHFESTTISKSDYTNTASISGENELDVLSLSLTNDAVKPQQVCMSKNIANNSSKSGNNIVYTCESCTIGIESYDKMIQHCQNHYVPTEPNLATLKICSICSIKFEIESYETHKKIHLVRDSIIFLSFDPTYFTAENKIWMRHIFASVTPTIQKQVISKSMYQHECRIKMEIVQKGPPHLTVYKCCLCGNFIDPGCLIAHIQETCHKKVKKYPCSSCGLPLVSNDFRTKHENDIHKRYDGVRLKSYNIVSINCETHHSYNASIINAMNSVYLLYQCRTCQVVVEKFQRNTHSCNFDELQKCDICGLILYKENYMKHISKHSELPMYNINNLKVVLFGNEEETSQEKKIVSSFSGTVCDYKLYKCSICEVCANDNKIIHRHACILDDSKWKCPKCGFYICSRSIKQHIKLHEVDTDFKTENIKIIHVNNENVVPLDDTINKIKHPGEPDNDRNKITRDMDNANSCLNNNTNQDQRKEPVALYKCVCGLHFINEINAKSHSEQCSPKAKDTRQKCSKCGLTFNPKELFSHIITHHSDKNKTLTYDIVEISAGK